MATYLFDLLAITAFGTPLFRRTPIPFIVLHHWKGTVFVEANWCCHHGFTATGIICNHLLCLSLSLLVILIFVLLFV